MLDFIYQNLESVNYTHLHPAVTHLPVGMVVGAFLFASGAQFFERPQLWTTARHCLILAFVFMWPSLLFGYMDWQYHYEGKWLSAITTKIILSVVLVVWLSVSIRITRNEKADPKIILGVYFIALLLVTALGYYGGKLVYQ